MKVTSVTVQPVSHVTAGWLLGHNTMLGHSVKVTALENEGEFAVQLVFAPDSVNYASSVEEGEAVYTLIPEQPES